AGQTGEQFIENCSLQRFADEGLQKGFEVFRRVLAGACYTNELGSEDGGAFSSVACGNIGLPVGIVESERLKDCVLLFGGCQSFFDDGSGPFVVQRGELVQVHFDDQVCSGKSA